MLVTSPAAHQAGFRSVIAKEPFSLHDSARLGTTITACELDKHIAMQRAQTSCKPTINKLDGTSNRQAATSSWGLGMKWGNYHGLLGHPRRFRFTGIRCVDYASLKQAS
jgi:hypothetical protein